MITPLLLSLAIGYLLGSIPMAYLVARAHGVDIFTVGTRNPGAANTFRSVSRKAGILVFALDGLKGAGAVLVPMLLAVEPVELRVLAGAAAVVGHWYPVFLRFRGGAGLAPAIGVAFGTLPVASAIGAVPTVVLLAVLRNTGVACGFGFTVLLAAAVVLGRWEAGLALVVLAIAVILHTRFVLERRSASKQREPG
jgi:acyl phosphate:glycerol-3-phosphate acyltransferase